MYHLVSAEKLHQGVQEAMRILNDSPIIPGENQDREEMVKECQLVMSVKDTSDLTISKAMPTDLYGLVEYELELVFGARDFESNWDYTYHKLFSPYVNECIEELKRNHATRRAVLPIAGEKSYGSQNPPCMQVIMFKIRDDKLNTTAVFRSNDGVKAFTMNAFGIIRLANHIAHEVGVPVGEYTHVADSFHAYKNDWEQLNAYCRMFDQREDTFYTMKEYKVAYDEFAMKYLTFCVERKNLMLASMNH